jgi:hypothetical protein
MKNLKNLRVSIIREGDVITARIGVAVCIILSYDEYKNDFTAAHFPPNPETTPVAYLKLYHNVCTRACEKAETFLNRKAISQKT